MFFLRALIDYMSKQQRVNRHLLAALQKQQVVLELQDQRLAALEKLRPVDYSSDPLKPPSSQESSRPTNGH